MPLVGAKLPFSSYNTSNYHCDIGASKKKTENGKNGGYRSPSTALLDSPVRPELG
jgi:hypothetical protein